MGAHRRHDRLKRPRRRLASCGVVRHDSLVTPVRPHTKTYAEADRVRLGVAVIRARQASGYKWRPSFAEAAGISVASLLKLESGRPVGPDVYEAVARKLPGWTEDTPRQILEGGAVPVVEPESPPRELTEIERQVKLIYIEMRREGVSIEEATRRALEVARLLDQDPAVLGAAIEREPPPAG